MRLRFTLLASSVLLLAGCDLTGDLVYEVGTSSSTGGGGQPGGTGGTTSTQGGGGMGGMGGSPAGWTLQLGVERVERTGGIAVKDSAVALVGDYLTSIKIGDSTLSATGADTDVFVTLLDAATGTPDETKLPSLASAGVDSVAGVGFLDGGDIIVGGHFRDMIQIPTFSLTATTSFDEGWIARLDANLVNGAWSNRFRCTQFTTCFARVAHIAPVGDKVFAAGYFTLGMASNGNDVDLIVNSGCNDEVAFVTSIATDSGVPDWALSFGTFGTDIQPARMAASATHLYVAANRFNDISGSCSAYSGLAQSDFSPTAGLMNGPSDIYVFVVDHVLLGGNAFSFGSSGADRVGGLATNGDGVWVTGAMGAAGACGGMPTTKPGAFICHFDDTGVATAVVEIGGSLPPHNITIHGDTLYVIGDDPMLLDFGDGRPRSGIYLARFNIAGGAIDFEETQWLAGTALFTDMLATDDTLYLAGDLIADLELDQGLLTTNGATDIFVAALPR